MVFGGSVPLGINFDIYNALIQIARAGGAKAVLDADGKALLEGLKAKPFMIKPNLREAENALGKKFESKSDVARGTLAFAEMGIELVVISLGQQGAIAFCEGMIYDVVPPEVKSVSSIGSGDSLIAGVLCGLSNGASIEDALKLGCAAGAATAMSNGADVGHKSDIDDILPQVKVTRIEPAPV
jgi:6-phosphofructokinase 2